MILWVLCSSVLHWLFGVLCLSIWSLDEFIAIYKNSFLIFWLVLHWIYGPLEKNCCLNNVEFSNPLSSCIGACRSLFFYSSIIYSSLHITFIHILLPLCLGISFWECYKWYLILFNFTFSLLVYRKTIDFYILILNMLQICYICLLIPGVCL